MKKLVGRTASGREIWKTVPAITHPFKLGDRVEFLNGAGKIEEGVVIDIASEFRNPYNWNANIEIRVEVKFATKTVCFAQETVTQDLKLI